MANSRLRVTRRGMLGGAASIAGAGVGAIARAGGKGGKKRKDEEKGTSTPPSFLLIQLDDMRTADWAVLRRTRKALSGAAWFPNYVVGYPYCAASRASLLTGQYAHNHGIVSPDERACFGRWQDEQFDRIALGSVLQGAGYRTMMNGKFINGYEEDSRIPAGWNRWAGLAGGGHLGQNIVLDGKVVPTEKESFTTNVLGDYASEFIFQTPLTKPIFVMFNPNEPHGPIKPENRYRNRFSSVTLPRTGAFNEADVSDKPAYVSSMPLLDAEAIAAAEEWNRGRMRMLLSVDAVISRLIGDLKKSGRLDNTSIFIVSDNGYMLGEHRLSEKHAPYTPSAVIPMLAWGPGFKAGTDTRLISNVDIAPTCAELAGTVMPDADGISLIGRRERAYVPMYRFPSVEEGCGGRGLRSRDLLYFELETREREFYDLRNDPMELVNLLPPGGPENVFPAGLPGSKGLHALTEAYGACRGQTCSQSV